MSTRAARFSDIPRIAEIMEDAHKLSRDAEVTTFDDLEAKQLLVRCIQRHGQINYMGSLVLVAERKGAVTGFVIGILDQVYPCLKELKVTDLLFIVLPDSDPRVSRKRVEGPREGSTYAWWARAAAWRSRPTMGVITSNGPREEDCS